jgi:uncharacterized protein
MIVKFKEKLKKEKEIYLKLKINPGSSQNEIKEIMDDLTIKINITAKPIKNKANKELIKFLAKEFMVHKNNVIIISGLKDRVKLIRLTAK